MNSFAFESGGKRSIALDSSHIDRTSEEIVLRDTDGEKDQIISSKKQKVFPAKLKILHRRNQFHRQNHFNRFDNALISPISSKYNLVLWPATLNIPSAYPADIVAILFSDVDVHVLP